MGRTLPVLSWVLVVAVPLPALAGTVPQAAVADCSAAPALPPALAAWSSPHPAIVAATDGKAAPLVSPGTAVDAKLISTPRMKPDGSRTTGFGGFLAFETTSAGTWRVALGGRAWVDVIAAGQSAISVAHGHGPQCSGIAKYVDFALPAGRYLIQLSGSPVSAMGVMIAPAG